MEYKLSSSPFIHVEGINQKSSITNVDKSCLLNNIVFRRSLDKSPDSFIPVLSLFKLHLACCPSFSITILIFPFTLDIVT